MAEIKQYRKSELALKYFPECETKEGALSNLKSWIRGNVELTTALKSCGMPPRKKHQKVINDKKTYREPRRGKGSRAIPKP